MSNKLLQAQDFSVSLNEENLVNHLNFELNTTETLGIVGESGSGKSLTSLAIMGLLPDVLKPAGSLIFKGQNLLELDTNAHRALRMKELAMIFQEPMSALNPRMRCGAQVAEALLVLGIKPKAAKKRVLELFNQVRLPRPEHMYSSYPHQLSGGQKQRVVIAIALASKPSLLIADEPTTALDVSVQQSILELLRDLQVEMQMGMLFISHDLAVVQGVADQVLVMRKGEQLEYGTAEKLFNNPSHPYTRGLLACRPTADSRSKRLPLVEDFLADENTNTIEVSEEDRLKIAKAVVEGETLLEIKNLQKYFGKNNEVQAVKDVSFKIHTQESLGLVGESGSGKTTIGRVLCGLEQASAGSFFYQGQDLATASQKQWRQLNEDIQIIFQDPFSSLNPRIKVGEAVLEVLVYRKKLNRKQAKEKAIDLLEKTGLPAKAYDKYPHEFSGGQRQRIGIARALAMQPKLIVCDESVSALDVSVQAQVLNLLNDLKDEFGFSYLFISHDLAVVKYFCSRILVLQKGTLVEQGFSDALYKMPAHAYTKSLIEAMPH
jgi:peptide/nickel transport system ATP-binding protein